MSRKPNITLLPLPTAFTIRIYGILAMEGKVLLSHEDIEGSAFTKFPGGGLEFGEGTHKCLVREFKEETGLDMTVAELLYVNHDFIQSSFDKTEQVLGIYYRVHTIADIAAMPLNITQDFRGSKNTIRLEWKDISELDLEELTFPMDQQAWGNIKGSL